MTCSAPSMTNASDMAGSTNGTGKITRSPTAQSGCLPAFCCASDNVQAAIADFAIAQGVKKAFLLTLLPPSPSHAIKTYR